MAARARRSSSRSRAACFLAFPAHLLFQPPLGRAAGRCGSLLGPQLRRSLLDLLRDLRPLEIAALRALCSWCRKERQPASFVEEM